MFLNSKEININTTVILSHLTHALYIAIQDRITIITVCKRYFYTASTLYA